MKKLIIVCFSFLILNASELEILADKFEADETKNITIFDGNVKIKHNEDRISTNHLSVTLDKNRKPIKYSATGDSYFKLYIKDKIYEGKAQTIEYDSKELIYNFIGNVTLKELTQNNQITADRVLVDQKDGKYKVEGSSTKPAKFIFNIEDKK